MGSGKSTLGRNLAKHMDIEFIDLDRVIEKDLGLQISYVFREKGESFFREKEHAILTSLTCPNNTIIATGGGTPCFFNNHNYMNKMGSTIYLKITPIELYKRLKFDTKRPLLYNNKLNLQDFINEQLLEREKYYQMSDYTIESDGISVNDLYKLINKII